MVPEAILKKLEPIAIMITQKCVLPISLIFGIAMCIKILYQRLF